MTTELENTMLRLFEAGWAVQVGSRILRGWSATLAKSGDYYQATDKTPATALARCMNKANIHLVKEDTDDDS